MAMDYRKFVGLKCSDLLDDFDDDNVDTGYAKLHNKAQAEDRNREKSFRNEKNGG